MVDADGEAGVSWSVTRSAPGSMLLVDFAAEYGIPAHECLADTGLTLDDLGTLPQITAAQELTILDTLVSRLTATGRSVEGVGALLGMRYHLTTYGLWGFALISSATLREAIEVGLRMISLTFAFCDIRLREAGADGLAALVLTVADAEIPAPVRRLVSDRDSAAIMVIAREIMGRPLPVESVTSTFAAPEDPAHHVAAFGRLPRFGATENALWFSADLLDEPLPQANALITAEIRDQCRRLLQERRVRVGTAARVRDILLAAPAEPLTLRRAARDLHVGERALRRELSAEGTSLRAIVNEVREDLAEELLCVTGLSVAETARRLGYAEVSSFSQAFRRWKGMGPRAYRTSRSESSAAVTAR